MPRIALIMPARDEEAAVDDTMSSILASTRIPDEVIVADGMSSDRTVEKVLAYRGRGLNVRVVSNPAIFPGGGRNAGARETDCDILLFVDFGNRMDPHWIERMAAPLQGGDGVELVAGVYHALARTEFERCVASINYPRLVAHERASAEERRLSPPPNKPGGNIACTRALWARAGGVPDWLRAAEDKLFLRRLSELGARWATARDAVMHHHMRGSVGAVYRQYFAYGRGDGQTRILSRVFVKLLAVHGALLGLVAAAPLSPTLPAAAIALLAVYVDRAGIRKLPRHDTAPRRPIHLLYAAQIVVARDCGTIAGTIAGWLDWLSAPTYRRRFRAYLGEALSPARARVPASRSLALGRFARSAALMSALVLTMLASSSTLSDLLGPIDRVVDGDTLIIGDVVIHLDGIDAPELPQRCGREASQWRCGETARGTLERMIDGRLVACQLKRYEGERHVVAICWAGGTDLAEAMVEAGLARVEHSSSPYARNEASARQARRGIWDRHVDASADRRLEAGP